VGSSKKLNLTQILIITVLLLIYVGLEYYFCFILRVHTVYAHLFYIPIVLVALRWSLQSGFSVSLILTSLHIVFQLLNTELSFSSGSRVYLRETFGVSIASERGM